jgi:hypothetical protein
MNAPGSSAGSGIKANAAGITLSVFAVAVIGINGYLMNKYMSESQNAEEIKKATTWVTVVNSVFILFLAGFAYFNSIANPSFERLYFMITTHAGLLLGSIALSVSVLTKSE